MSLWMCALVTKGFRIQRAPLERWSATRPPVVTLKAGHSAPTLGPFVSPAFVSRVFGRKSAGWFNCTARRRTKARDQSQAALELLRDFAVGPFVSPS